MTSANPRVPNAYPYGMRKTMPRDMFTGGRAPTAFTDGVPNVASTTTLFLAEIMVPLMIRPSAIQLIGRAAGGNIKPSLYDANGNLIAEATPMAAAVSAFQVHAFVKPPALVPGMYLIGFQQDGAGTMQCHNFGWFRTAAITGQVYTTVPTKITVPSTFTTAVGPMGGFV